MQTTIALIKTLLESSLKGRIKNFYIGDPIIIPESSMPCISISPNATAVDVADNVRDIRTHTIDIALIIDARQYFNKTPNEMVGTTFLMELMSKENSDGTIDPSSILGIIRDNLTLSTNRFMGNEVSIDYTTRRRTEDLITLEAVATIRAEHISNR